MAHAKPIYQLILDKQDLTTRVAPRLSSLNMTLCRADEADQLDLVLTDYDGKLAIPKRGVALNIALGWETSGLVHQGLFTVDEIEHSGPPDQITVRARSASMTRSLHKRREQSWHEVSLATIVKTIAARHHLTPKVAAAFTKVEIKHIDQTHESDLSFLTRLAKQYDAVMTVKQQTLLFMPLGAARTVSGKALPLVEILRQATAQHRYHIAQREHYGGVQAYWHSIGQAKRQAVVVGEEDESNLKVLPEQYTSLAQAQAAARSEWQRIQRKQATISVTLALGRADLSPEMPIKLIGFKKEIDETPWLIARVSHALSDGGFSTTLECEVRDKAASER